MLTDTKIFLLFFRFSHVKPLMVM